MNSGARANSSASPRGAVNTDPKLLVLRGCLPRDRDIMAAISIRRLASVVLVQRESECRVLGVSVLNGVWGHAKSSGA
jgi:hypothetical protein